MSLSFLKNNYSKHVYEYLYLIILIFFKKKSLQGFWYACANTGLQYYAITENGNKTQNKSISLDYYWDMLMNVYSNYKLEFFFVVYVYELLPESHSNSVVPVALLKELSYLYSDSSKYLFCYCFFRCSTIVTFIPVFSPYIFHWWFMHPTILLPLYSDQRHDIICYKYQCTLYAELVKYSSSRTTKGLKVLTDP